MSNLFLQNISPCWTDPSRCQAGANMEMDAAKRLLAPDTPLEAWHASGADGCPTVQLAADGAAVTVSSATASTRFVDNVPRVAVSALGDDGSGDSLPHTPVVLTGCCDRWPAWRSGSGESWSAERLAARLPARTGEGDEAGADHTHSHRHQPGEV